MKHILKKMIRWTVVKLRGYDRPLRDRFPKYEIGAGSYGPLQVRDWGEGSVLKIGNYVSIADGVKVFLGGEHRMDWVTTFPFNVLWDAGKMIKGHPKSKGDVVIGSDVWLGTEAMVMSGVSIGCGAVVGARSLVTKDVPPYAVVAGNPAQVVKYRFDQGTIDELMEIQWWNWDEQRIAKAIPALQNNNVHKFITGVKSGEL